MKVWMDGELVDRADAKLTVFDHGTLYGDGVFEGIRVYDAKIFQCEAHMDRLFASAKAISLAIPYTKDELVDAMYRTFRANELVDGYIRLAVTRGAGTLGLDPDKCPHPSVFIIADQVALYPPEMYEAGLAVIVAKTVRTSARSLNPAIKSMNYLNNIIAKLEAIDAGAIEAVMLNDAGNVAECTGDNVFVVESGRVITPPPEDGILVGVTRGVVIRLAERLGIPLAEESLSTERLRRADECFLTGTAAEVIPVTQVDGQKVGEGEVGPVTRQFLAAFQKFIRSDEA